MQRLQKYIAAAGVASRRAAERLIVEGRVKVDGRVVTELGTQVADDAVVEVDGELIKPLPRLRYVLLNKPAGFITTRSDPQSRRTIYDLLHEHDRVLHPVGRLDRESAGLLILTNDGDLTHRLTHPRWEVEKTYLVWTQPWPDRKGLSRVRAGAELDDGYAKPRRAKIHAPDCYEVVLTEGRYHEVRRLFGALQYEVELLRRVQLGPITLGSLKEGRARALHPPEIERLRAAVGLKTEG